MITYNDKAYTSFYVLNVLEDDGECGSFIVISTDSLLFYEKTHYLQDYLGKDPFETND